MIVSAFVLQRNRSAIYDLDEYLNRFRYLAETGLPILLFLDRSLDGKVSYPNVRMELTSITDLPLWQRLQGIDVILPLDRDLEKDTLDFLIITNSKTEFVRRAAELYPQCARLTWVDFGISKVLSNPQHSLQRLVECDVAPAGFTAPGCWNQPKRVTDSICWRYAGGVFTVDRASALALHDAHWDTIETLLPRLTWEVNIWSWMESIGKLGGTNGVALNWYQGNHDDTLFNFPAIHSRGGALTTPSDNGKKAMNQRPQLCLNMIVRNESAIIERALQSIIGIVDCCVICDTGSTDATQELIRSFCDTHGIPCELHAFPFVDFSQARNEALNRARQSTLAFDYLLLFDADMELKVNDLSALEQLHAEAALVQQESSTITYQNVRLVRRSADARYVGATHEALVVKGEVTNFTGLFFVDHADGASRPEKLVRDEGLLRAALAQDPSDSRSMFYLAQTLRDAHRYSESIEWYERRYDAGGWEEERWYSRYQIAICQQEQGETAAFVSACLDAYAMRPTRSEPLVRLARHYANSGKHDAALLLIEQAAQIPWPQSDRLFVEREAYGDIFRELTSISGYYSALPERRRAGHEACEALAVDAKSPPDRRWAARNNLTYYSRPLAEICPGATTRQIEVILPPPFVATNPSFVLDGDCYRGIVKGVNYLLSNGQYTIHDDRGIVRTRNFWVQLNADLQLVGMREMLDLSLMPRSADARIRGFEDCRLFRWQEDWWCSATSRELGSDARATIVLLKLNQDGDIVNAYPMLGFADDQHQKNWMPSSGERLRYIYSCGPTIVLDASAADGSFVVESSVDPGFAIDHWRGGSQLIPWEGGLLAVVHEARDTANGRQYVHRFIVFDATNKPVAASNGFHFNSLGVEFAAGLTPSVDGRSVLISYGAADCEAWIALVPVEEIQSLLKPFTSCGNWHLS